MHKILTYDNTETYFNDQVGESYHSYTGAVEEALKKYAIPCQIREKAKTGKLQILDICFGLGYNSALAVSEALAENPDCDIEVVGLESDPEIINNISTVNPPIPFYQHYKKLKHPGSLKFSKGKVSVRVLLGDGREKIKKLENDHFDAVFFDPFSPKTSPEMWQTAFFEEVHRVLNKTGIMATYTCARMARDNMAAAGLFYNDGPIVGRRGPGTIATKWTY